MLDPKAKALATGTNYAVLTTLMPDGQPQTQLMWVHADDEHLLMNTEVHRQKFKNIERDPRVTVTLLEDGNPFSYVEVRGRVVDTVRGDAARADIDALSEKYMGGPYAAEVQSERVTLKIAPDRQVVR